MTEWNQYKGDSRNSGLRRDIDGPARVTEAWSADLVGPPGSPVLDRDAVYVGTSRGNCYAFDRETGHRRWVLETTAATDATPIVFRDRLFFGTDDGTITAVDTATGERQWRTDLPADLTAAGLAFSDGRLYVGHAAGLVAFDAETGTEIWSHETDSAVVGCPAIADGRDRDRSSFDRRNEHAPGSGPDPDPDPNPIDGHREPTRLGGAISARDRDADHNWTSERVFVGTDYGSVRALDAETGAEAWSAPIDGTIQGGPTVADGRVYVAADGTVLSLNAASGQAWFTYENQAGFTTAPTVLAAADATFVGAADGYLHVTDTTVGRRKLRGWLFSRKGVELDGPVRSCPVVAGDVLCVGDASGSLYGIAATDPEPLWHFALGDAISGAPAVAPERLYLGSDDGTLQCLAWDADEPLR
ncbi:outer membrane protein assembly factor BamB family protein [Natrinema salifodinae]|uniref:Beta-barrel assembly machine subunit BamB n=1 Tax=Natrinema salifodinae TaxID=1202768 RepID=A0A1I0QDX0_9EURY|nr:PQQ-binding-like beta-propeller repeat protein [Natrinema salifodinae]SEW25091.1 Beta-barrel assembly machine subunit BamB [Natrinema salifodinae]